jgi:hypothetical protein
MYTRLFAATLAGQNTWVNVADEAAWTQPPAPTTMARVEINAFGF